MIDMDSKKGRCTSASGVREGDDMQKQQKTYAEMTKKNRKRMLD